MYGSKLVSVSRQDRANTSAKTPIICLGMLGWLAAAYMFPPYFTRHRSPQERDLPVTAAFATPVDPPIGSKLSWMASQELTLNHSHSPGFLLIALGPCDSCSLRSFDESTIPSDLNWTLAIVVARDSREARITKRGEVGSRIAYRIELPLRDYYRLNAAWTPRYYFCSSEGVLRGVQKLGQPISEAAKEMSL